MRQLVFGFLLGGRGRRVPRPRFFFDDSFALLAGFFGDFGDVFINKSLEVLVSGYVLLNGGQLVARDVFGDVVTVLAVLEVVVRLTVGTDADDGEMAAFHKADGGHLFNAVWYRVGLHGQSIYQSIHHATKNTENLRNFQITKNFVVYPLPGHLFFQASQPPKGAGTEWKKAGAKARGRLKVTKGKGSIADGCPLSHL